MFSSLPMYIVPIYHFPHTNLLSIFSKLSDTPHHHLARMMSVMQTLQSAQHLKFATKSAESVVWSLTTHAIPHAVSHGVTYWFLLICECCERSEGFLIKNTYDDRNGWYSCLLWNKQPQPSTPLFVRGGAGRRAFILIHYSFIACRSFSANAYLSG